MDSYTVTKLFLDYYQSKGCQLTPDYGPLPPPTDTSTLFVSSGMQPLKHYYTGRETPPVHQLCGVQTCVRSTDLDNVGHTSRHLTSFSMLGHFGWNLRSYDEPIRMGWELMTDVFGLDVSKLHVTWYGGGVVEPDTSTREIWTGLVDPGHIHPGGEDNFWRMGETGPCGPSTEIFYRMHEQPCSVGCSPTTCGCDRWLEIYNLVLTQYEQLTSEPHNLRRIGQHLDTGLGLERLCMVLQGVDSVYETDVCTRWWEQLRSPVSPSSRIIVDHLQTLERLKGVGLSPGNKKQHYLVRQLVRRIINEGDKLGLEGLGRLSGFEGEEIQYRKILERGRRLIGRMTELNEEQIRFLHETHGLPRDVTLHLWSQRE